MAIKEIAFTCYPVTNLSKSREFYETILGLKPTSVWGDGNQGFVEYDLGNATFAIGAGSENFKVSSSGACVSFEVDDFDTMIDNLKKSNVKFRAEPADTPVCRIAVIDDPDGSAIMIHKRKTANSSKQ